KAQLDTILTTKPDLKYHGYNAGFARGIRFKINTPPYDDIRVRRAIHLGVDRQEMLQTLTFGAGGINQFTTSVARECTLPEANRQGAYEMTLFSNGMNETPDSGLRMTWSSKGSVGRNSGLIDPELDRLIDQQSIEMDRAKRVEVLRKINQLMADRVYFVPLV